MHPLADGIFVSQNQWCVAAWSKEVSRKKMKRWILGESVAFYRKEDGSSVADHDRRPRRSYRGDSRPSGYHGIICRSLLLRLDAVAVRGRRMFKKYIRGERKIADTEPTLLA